MREIKFRGLTAKGELVYGYLVQDRKGTTAYWDQYSQRICWHPERGGYANAPVKNGTVGQFTGLHDKNGREIYEGDVVDLGETVNGCNLFTIEWDGFCLKLKYAMKMNTPRFYEYSIVEFYEICNETGQGLEVIGNIHENPELLEG